MIIEILELAAALEWIALGVLVFLKLRSLKRRAMDLMDSLGAISENERAYMQKETTNDADR